MRKVLREPLLHFLLIGAALFILFGLVNDKTFGDADTRFVVSAGRINQLEIIFTKTWQRPPTVNELTRISHSLVKIRVFSLQDVNEPGTCQRMAIIRANAPVLVLSDASGVCFSVTFRGSGKALRALVVQAQ